MYRFFRNVRDLAEDIRDRNGSIDTIDMGPWGERTNRINFTGKTDNGDLFELTLEITRQEEAQSGD